MMMYISYCFPITLQACHLLHCPSLRNCSKSVRGGLTVFLLKYKLFLFIRCMKLKPYRHIVSPAQIVNCATLLLLVVLQPVVEPKNGLTLKLTQKDMLEPRAAGNMAVSFGVKVKPQLFEESLPCLCVVRNAPWRTGRGRERE